MDMPQREDEDRIRSAPAADEVALPEEGEVLELPLTDVLDLHGFLPKDVAEVVRAYLDDAFEAGFESVRLIHGKGIGVQREIVRNLLERDSRVASYGDAPGIGGGWGATLARFKR